MKQLEGALRAEAKRHGSAPPDDCDLEKKVSALIERAIEGILIAPMQAKLMANEEELQKEDDTRCATRIILLYDQPQTFFGLKKEHASCDNWATAVYELSRLSDEIYPSVKIAVLITTAKEIYRSHQLEHQGSDSPFLAGDDFLPICIYVLVQASKLKGRLAFSHAEAEYMRKLCDPNVLVGQEGYYLTVFTAALQYIEEVDKEFVKQHDA